ncbi:hypothetical protein AJ80_07921 [Polytolypa hystricis UAMH7299]|uniref:Uncharacterized protein n=1 Tax=Polytolypa hystricis (strain UAMH7299) TaxID=1447883 RepID=A0A2B7XHJ9_POLH7|nr:hypothetical protein AJ80_07921 [Polytolypa hystricis UAMH7299]
MADIDMAETQFSETQFSVDIELTESQSPLGEEDWLQSLPQFVTPTPARMNNPPAVQPPQINFTGRNSSGRPAGQLWISDEEQLELVHWCVGNQQLYCEGLRQQFWNELKAYFLETYNRELKNPDWVLTCLAKIHWQKQAQLLRDSGKAESETDLDQALDQWVQILDDICENRRRAREEAAASEESDWTIARRMQDNMMEHMRNKRRLGDPSPDPEFSKSPIPQFPDPLTTVFSPADSHIP